VEESKVAQVLLMDDRRNLAQKPEETASIYLLVHRNLELISSYFEILRKLVSCLA
jgi:hypothetical protein